MRIKKFLHQNRRDFKAEFECEGCGEVVTKWGYDDSNYHQNVVPTMKCPKCGKNAIDLGTDYRPLMTRYPDGMTV